MHTTLAYILYYRSLAMVNITLIAILSYFDPIVAIITDVVFLDRHLNLVQIFGVILTFVGSYWVIKLNTQQLNTPRTNTALMLNDT